jgi:hypothetical protein
MERNMQSNGCVQPGIIGRWVKAELVQVNVGYDEDFVSNACGVIAQARAGTPDSHAAETSPRARRPLRW